MENKNEYKELTIESLEKYINEWFKGYTTKYCEVLGHPDETSYTVFDHHTGDVVYMQILKTIDMEKGKDLIVSTNGFVDDEFRAIIEKCIDLDIQIASYKNNDNKLSKKQKGE